MPVVYAISDLHGELPTPPATLMGYVALSALLWAEILVILHDVDNHKNY